MMGGLNISIFSEECEGRGHGAWSSTATVVPKESNLHCGSIDLSSYSSSSSTSSQKGKLPMVLEESESLAHREGSSVGDTSSSSRFSNASSSVSSTDALFRKVSASADEKRKRRKPQELRKVRRECGEASIMSMLLWPLKKVRDGYMSCMMGLDRAGDLSGLAQGSTYATSSKYFADLPLSKTDFKNHG